MGRNIRGHIRCQSDLGYQELNPGIESQYNSPINPNKLEYSTEEIIASSPMLAIKLVDIAGKVIQGIKKLGSTIQQAFEGLSIVETRSLIPYNFIGITTKKHQTADNPIPLQGDEIWEDTFAYLKRTQKTFGPSLILNDSPLNTSVSDTPFTETSSNNNQTVQNTDFTEFVERGKYTVINHKPRREMNIKNIASVMPRIGTSFKLNPEPQIFHKVTLKGK